MAFEPDIPPIQVHLCVKGGQEAIAWYEKAFGAVETFQQMAEDGERVMHANLTMFGSEIMLHDEFPELAPDVMSPPSRGGAGLTVNVNLAFPIDVDRAIKRAASAGAKITMPVGDQFWGARYGRIRDPFGHVWAFSAPLVQAG
ncbi:VOC family protein [Mesorhizobium sp. ASY16-5R]|uniref:VOC family protein n=1 Tax=Mesorhizobium sp. ASY16-5R TaxID=3445772 RepID=UPI003F9FF8D5